MNRFFAGFFSLAVLCAQAYASEANIFNVTSSGKTFTIRTTVPNHYYPSAGIKIMTSGYQITSGCSTIANGYCVFGVSDSQPATVTFSGSSGSINFNLCLDGNGPLSCQNFTQQVNAKNLYVGNLLETGPDGVEVCAVQSDGTLNNCIPAGNTINNFDGPASISINANNTIAYVVNYPGTSISVCPINADGTFANCIQNVSFNFSYGGSAISPDGNTLFVTNYNNNTVDACPIDAFGLLGSCVDTGAGTSIGSTQSPYGMTLNKAGTIAYVASLGTSSDEVAVCTVSGTTFTCQDSGGAFASPLGIAFSSDESQVYVGNTQLNPPFVFPSVSVCDVGPGGSLSCLDSGYSVGTPWGILIDGQSGNAYVSDYTANSIALCSINPSNGQFNSCIDSGVGGNFNGPTMMAISN